MSTLNYTQFGPVGKIPVLFIHGFPFNQTMWQPQVEALQSGYHLITYDNRGHGKTPAGDGQYTLELFVDDLIALLDELNLSKVVLCGLSMGGYIALRAIERHPDRVHALVLCDTRAEADSNEAKVKRTANLKVVKEKGVPAFAEGFLKAIFAPGTFETNPQAVDLIRKAIVANSPTGIIGTLIALAARTDTTAALSTIQVPTLILVGDQDPVTPPAAAETLHRGIAHSELHVIPRAAHLSNLENPVDYNRHLAAFLKRVL
jgi:3-oxoadipate enol-lactonase